jgi:hypothetical protein
VLNSNTMLPNAAPPWRRARFTAFVLILSPSPP